jgi:hypothetical protein
VPVGSRKVGERGARLDEDQAPEHLEGHQSVVAGGQIE